MPRIHVGIRERPLDGEGMLIAQNRTNSKGEHSSTVQTSFGGNKAEFFFDNYFGPSCSQSEIFDTCGRAIINEALEG